MIATKAAVKRKIYDEVPVESENPSKIRKVEKIRNANKQPKSTNETDSSVVFSSGEFISTTKIRQKLSSILHFEKKYKYYCKKHNVLYLIEKTRKKSRELSKKSRDHLVHSFRSLDLTKNVSVSTHLGNPQQLLPSMEVEFDDDGRDSFTQSISDSAITECKIQRIFVTSDESETDTCLAQCKENMSSNQSANKVSLNQLIYSFISCDESEDSDYDEGYTDDEECYETPKDENFILIRSPGGTSVIMKKIEDSLDVNYYEDCCTHHYCALKQYYNKNLCDYDSSFDED